METREELRNAKVHAVKRDWARLTSRVHGLVVTYLDRMREPGMEISYVSQMNFANAASKGIMKQILDTMENNPNTRVDLGPFYEFDQELVKLLNPFYFRDVLETLKRQYPDMDFDVIVHFVTLYGTVYEGSNL